MSNDEELREEALRRHIDRSASSLADQMMNHFKRVEEAYREERKDD